MTREAFRQLMALLVPDPRQATKLGVLVALSALLALLEAVGVGSIGPLIAVLQSPERFAASRFGEALTRLTGTSDPQRFILVLGAAILVLFFVKTLVALVNGFLTQRFSQSFFTSLSSRLLEGYMNMPYQRVASVNSAVLIRNVIMESRLIVDHIVLQGLAILSEGLVVVMILAALFYVDVVAALVVAILAALLLGVLIVAMRLAGRHFGSIRESSEAELVKLAQSAITGLREIRLAGVGSDAVARFRSIAARLGRATTMVSFVNIVPRIALEAISIASVLGALVVVSLSGSTSSLPTLAMFVGAGYRLLPAFNRIYASGMMFYFVLPSLIKLAPTLNESLQFADAPGAVAETMPVEFQELSARSVSFAYEGTAAPVIKAASLEVRRGEMIGIIGASGAGKTTLINLLLGLVPPTSGSVCLNGQAIKTSGEIARLQGSVAYVAQAVFIADDTLINNIALAAHASSVDQSRLEAAIEMARLQTVVVELPDGLATAIGERGARLSGGQAQRIGIARALYLDRPLLVLDEATSALDVDTERSIIKALSDHLAGKAVIAISHRHAALAGCNRVYRLEGGRLTELDDVQMRAMQDPSPASLPG